MDKSVLRETIRVKIASLGIAVCAYESLLKVQSPRCAERLVNAFQLSSEIVSLLVVYVHLFPEERIVYREVLLSALEQHTVLMSHIISNAITLTAAVQSNSGEGA